MNTILIGEHKLQTRILFIDRAAFSHSGIQNLFADTQIFRCYFKKFIGINKVKCLFEAENTRRCQTKCFICAGRTCVSKMTWFPNRTKRLSNLGANIFLIIQMKIAAVRIPSWHTIGIAKYSIAFGTSLNSTRIIDLTTAESIS